MSELVSNDMAKGGENAIQSAGRRKKSNPWLEHVKFTMRKNRGVGFKKILKIAKKSFKKSKSNSRHHRKSRSHRNKRGGSAVGLEDLLKQQQKGGSAVGLEDVLKQQQQQQQKGGSAVGLEDVLKQQQQKGGSGVGGGKEGAATMAEKAAPVV